MAEKKFLALAVLSVIMLGALASLVGQTGPRPSGPYLGQRPPGDAPQIFAPGFISTGMDEAPGAFSPAGDEFFFTVLVNGHETLAFTKSAEGGWTPPEVVSFSGTYVDGFPSFHPDGRKLFFHSNRPLSGGAQFNIWYAEKTEAGWGEPRPVGPPVNGARNAVCPSLTRGGTIYFSRQFEDDAEFIFRSACVEGRYQEPERLPDTINTRKAQYHQAVSPDESCLVLPLYGRKDAVTPAENFYVSFRDESGRWGELINLGKAVHAQRIMGTSSFSPDGKYFFFNAFPQVRYVKAYDRAMGYADLQALTLREPSQYKTDIFWVDARIIRDLKPKQKAGHQAPASPPARAR